MWDFLGLKSGKISDGCLLNSSEFPLRHPPYLVLKGDASKGLIAIPTLFLEGNGAYQLRIDHHMVGTGVAIFKLVSLGCFALKGVTGHLFEK